MNKFPNVLLAEDDVDDYMFFIEAVEKASPSSKITRAVNGLECIAILKSRLLPDIIFLDLNMPIKNGLDCLKVIKETERFKEIPVIILSTSHYIKDIDTAYRAGAHHYIVKPVCTTHLCEAIEKVLMQLADNPQRAGKENFVVRPLAVVEH